MGLKFQLSSLGNHRDSKDFAKQVGKSLGLVYRNNYGFAKQ